jgi:hypothetical protein
MSCLVGLSTEREKKSNARRNSIAPCTVVPRFQRERQGGCEGASTFQWGQKKSSQRTRTTTFLGRLWPIPWAGIPTTAVRHSVIGAAAPLAPYCIAERTDAAQISPAWHGRCGGGRDPPWRSRERLGGWDHARHYCAAHTCSFLFRGMDEDAGTG